MPKVKGKFDGDIEVKRFYMPGIIVEDECSKCLEVVEWSGESDYISYPNTSDKNMHVHMYCQDCENEWEIPITLEITVKLKD